MHDPPPLTGIQPRPGAIVKCPPGRQDGSLNVSRVGLCHTGNRLLGGRVDGLEGLPTSGGNPLSVDKQIGLPNHSRRRHRVPQKQAFLQAARSGLEYSECT